VWVSFQHSLPFGVTGIRRNDILRSVFENANHNYFISEYIHFEKYIAHLIRFKLSFLTTTI
jgi:hypothetical protein